MQPEIRRTVIVVIVALLVFNAAVGGAVARQESPSNPGGATELTTSTAPELPAADSTTADAAPPAAPPSRLDTAALSAPPVHAVVVTDDWLVADGVPAGLTPTWVADALTAEGVVVTVVPATSLPADAELLVNPYGQAFPDTTSVNAALDGGAAWVNLAGVPFLAPNGVVDQQRPVARGVFALGADNRFVARRAPTELGAALLPSLTAEDGRLGGPVVHAADPADERPLASYLDADGVDAGPAITLMLAPSRVVAVAPVGDDHPLNPSRASAGPLLAELVHVAAAKTPRIQSMTVTVDSGDVVVDATASGGRLDGTGRFAAPESWSPAHTVLEWATVRLYDQGALVDLRRLPANPARVTVDGPRIGVNGEPFIVKGMGPSIDGSNMPRDTPPEEQARIARQDLAAMVEMGVNALRSWSPVSDWLMNRAAHDGLFLMDSLAFGWEVHVTDQRMAELLPWANFLGARAAERHNVLILSIGNEVFDLDAANVVPRLEQLTQTMRAANGGHQPITYAAAETEPVTLGPLPFLDVYSYNNYGLTWPLSLDSAGFAATLVGAMQFMQQGRPFLVTEFGGSSTPTAQLELATGINTDVLQLPAAVVMYEKWATMMATGTSGGFAFIWADSRDHDFLIPYWRELTGGVEYPPGSGYHPLNTEEYFGLHDIYRNPRPAYWALRYAYSGQGQPPLIDLSSLEGLLPRLIGSATRE